MYILTMRINTETSHLVRNANQMTGFYMKCNTILDRNGLNDQI